MAKSTSVLNRGRVDLRDYKELTRLTRAVACPRNMKFEAVKVMDRYEENVCFKGESANRETKNGVAVIIT